MSSEKPLDGVYLVKATAGNVGMPGAPILHLSLAVNAAKGTIAGHAVQTQALKPPYDHIEITITKGQVRAAGLGKYTKLVALEGSALISFPPPAIGSYLAPFTAHFAVDDSWNGRGGWTLGSDSVDDVPIKAND